jgi:hypothetical protein
MWSYPEISIASKVRKRDHLSEQTFLYRKMGTADLFKAYTGERAWKAIGDIL